MNKTNEKKEATHTGTAGGNGKDGSGDESETRGDDVGPLTQDKALAYERGQILDAVRNETASRWRALVRQLEEATAQRQRKRTDSTPR
jgi:hypothetical protein